MINRHILPMCLVAFFLPLGAALAAERATLDLSGTWQYQSAESLDQAPDPSAWRDRAVPGYLNGHDYQRAWFRREFSVPAVMEGKRLKLRFGGVKYNSRVLVNGKRVGGCFGGYRPFEVDVTNAVRLDGPNELLVGCHDWTGIFTPELPEVDFSKKADWARVRYMPRDRILSPIGGLYSLYGIWDDVSLEARSAVYTKDLFIRPSVRQGELVVEYTLANESDEDAEVELLAAVEDGNRDVISFAPQRVSIPAGKTAKATLRKSWKDPPLWSHVDPHLLHLRSELSSGDRLRTRFGFREFWVEGHRFFLNGVPINLLATSWWPPHSPMSRGEIAERWSAIKRCGCVAFRTHTQPWRSVHYDVADELGLLMIVEGAVWNDDGVYRLDDPVFWENYAGHLHAMIDRDKNRPSVVMWSLENEFHGGRLNDEHPAKTDLIRMGKLVKQWDPTRPMFYESDGDPGGVADCIGIHYPHEYPEYTCWPNEIYWLEQPKRLHTIFHNGQELFSWNKEKPLYIGEFLWIPSNNPDWHTVFLGDDAYRDYRRARNRAKAESWKMQILGYRRLGVAGISPWTVVEGGPLDETNLLYQAHQYAYQHVAAYCHDFDSRFYAGESVSRRVEVFNDIMAPSHLELTWTLQTVDGKAIDRDSHTLELAPAEKQMLDVSLDMPAVTTRTELNWTLQLHRNGERVFDDVHHYAVFPKIVLPATKARLGVYDPGGATRRLLVSCGATAVDVASLADIGAEVDVLLIGAGALETLEPAPQVLGGKRSEREALFGFAARGGRVLVLRQSRYPEGLLDMTLGDHESTMTFALRASHPVLNNVRAEDLKFWRGDHRVTSHEPLRPVSGPAGAIIASGSRQGLNHAPLLERLVGSGLMVCCQLRLIEKFDDEPAAAQILANLLTYLDQFKGSVRKTALFGGSPEYRYGLRALGLEFTDVKTGASAADLSSYGLVICRGDVPGHSGLSEFVRGGGNLLVHRPSPDTLARLGKALELDFALQPYRGEVQRSEDRQSLLEHFTREDLYWLGEHEGIAWHPTPRAGEMADGLLTKRMEGKSPTPYEIEDWRLEGGIVERREPGVIFATTGTATGEVDFSETGSYVIGVLASGTPCEGVYPVVQVSVDDKSLGLASLGQGNWHTVTAFGRIEKGRRKVTIAFVNDGANAERREDRNLMVDKVLVARDRRGDDDVLLTTPAAAVAIERGRGRVVIDMLRWDTEDRNGRKAQRYGASLLTALGADFHARGGVTLQCERMTPQPGMDHFHVRDGHVAQACNGWVGTPLEVATSGKYSMEIVAAGTPCEGVFPLVEVRIDDRPVGQIQLTGEVWHSYFLDVELAEGKHDLKIVFLNDKNIPGVEDRNLLLDRVTFSQTSRP